MSLSEEYKVIKLSQENMATLIPLYKDAFGQTKTVEQIAAKFDTAVFGANMLAHIALDKKGNAAGFYALFPVKYKVGGKEIIAAQVGDLMTHSKHRRKGLYIHLAHITHDVAYAEGVEMIFTIPHEQTEGSYSGFVNRLGFQHIHSWNGYYIKVNAMPMAYLFSKKPQSKKFYFNWANKILRRYATGKPFAHQVEVPYGEVIKSPGFIMYKAGYKNTHFVKAGNTVAWVKLSGNVLQVGDIQRTGNEDFKAIMSKLKRIAYVLGVRVIQFECSPGTYWDNYFIQQYKPLHNFHICVLNPKGFNTEELKFTFADIDSY